MMSSSLAPGKPAPASNDQSDATTTDPAAPARSMVWRARADTGAFRDDW
jgi:hypothetical protein